MDNYSKSMKEERDYLKNVVEIIQGLLTSEEHKLLDRKEKLISSRRDMWNNSSHSSNDFDRLTEMNQHLQQVSIRTFDYENTRKVIDKYSKMVDSPYFGRFDFTEDGCEETERIYIGRGNVTDPQSNEIMVYDWRAPISSMFYRFEPGKGSFKAPSGEISGEITLKRQYRIVKSQLKYFFDCSVQIIDEILHEVLSRNSSPKMRAIIETIQKEQDIIIRDTENDLLIVQGVAGSGKTSIALHRIAFLLYEGMSSKLEANNILILSPNHAFSSYINHVLPELGEENVEQVTFEDITRGFFTEDVKDSSNFIFHGRTEQIEACISGRGSISGDTVSKWVEFKGSGVFVTIIDRYLKYYEHHLLKFEDVYYSNKLIASRQELKSFFLNNKTGMPMAMRLSRIESRLQDTIEDLKKDRLKKLENIVWERGGHEFEEKSFSKLLLIKDSQTFTNKLRRFTKIDIFSLYEGLFSDKTLFHKLSKGLQLPEDMDEMITWTFQTIRDKCLYYEDWTALTYMKIKVYGANGNPDIRQVVIDEVQDYYPLQLAILKELYADARYTVVGDIAQSIERTGDISIYDQMPGILVKRKTIKLCLNRSYRSSFEINQFSKRIAGGMPECISFPRNEEEPEILSGQSDEKLQCLMLERIQRYYSEGFESVAILCKTMKQAKMLYQRISKQTCVKLVDGNDDEIGKGCYVMPVYMAKGLEFDAVLVYGVEDINYCTDTDRRLLYIACTRALHRLSLYHTGEKSRFLKGR